MAVRTAAGTLASRLTGLLRLVMIAYALGGNNAADAFNLANNTPNMVHDLVLGGVLGATFVPVFVDRLANRTREQAAESISAVLTLAFVVLVVATVFFELCAPTIIDLYTFGTASSAEHVVAVDLLRMFAPQLLFYGVISLSGAVLAARGRFILVGFAPVLNNLVAIAVLATLAAFEHNPSPASLHAHTGLLVFLGVGTTLGVAAQAAAVVPALRRVGIRLRWSWHWQDEAVQSIVSLSGWTFGFVLANQIAVFVVLALEFHLGTDRVSSYTYAFNFFQFPFAVVATSVVAVATPGLARAYLDGSPHLVGQRFGLAARRVFAFVLPAMVGYLVLARPIILLVLHHGSFTNADVRQTASVLALFSLGLPGYCIYFLSVRTFQAMRDTRTAFFLYLVENGINILLAFVLYRSLDVEGLALSYAIAYTLAAGLAVYVLRERLGTLGGRAIARTTGRAIVLSLTMALAVAFVTAILGTGAGLWGWIRLLIAVAIGGVVYLGGAGAAAATTSWQTSRRTSPGLHRRSDRGVGSHRH